MKSSTARRRQPAFPACGRVHVLAERQAANVLRMTDGGLRCVVECSSPAASLADVVASVGDHAHPVQVVVQARADLADGSDQLERLRVAQSRLLASLRGEAAPLAERLLVVVPWDPAEAGDGHTIVAARLRRVAHDMRDLGVDATAVTGPALDKLLPEDDIREHAGEVRIGDRWARTLLVLCHPARLDHTWLAGLGAEHDLAVHLRPLSSGAEVTCYLTLHASSRDQLDAATGRAEAILSAQGVRCRRPHLQAKPALISSLPLCRDVAPQPLVLRVASMPAAASSAGQRPAASLLYGLHPGSRLPVELDRFAMPNPHAVVLGGDRAVRTEVLQLEVVRARLAGCAVHVVDPSGEHATLAAELGGALVAAGPKAPFDPFSPAGELDERVELLSAIVELLLGPLAEDVRAVLSDSIAFVYASRGYTADSADRERTPPDLSDVASVLARRAARLDEPSTRQMAAALAERLAAFTKSEGHRLVQRPALRLLADRPFTLRSLADVTDELRPAATLMALDEVQTGIPATRPALALVDGVEALLGCELAARFLARLMDRLPRHHAGLTLVAGNSEAVLASPLRDRLLRAGTVVMLPQAEDATARLADALHLTPAERSWLLAASPREGLLLADGRRLAFELVASEEERRLITHGGGR